jgi:hypothetical protein
MIKVICVSKNEELHSINQLALANMSNDTSIYHIANPLCDPDAPISYKDKFEYSIVDITAS